VRFSNRSFEVKRFPDHPPPQVRYRSRARASLRNRHRGPSKSYQPAEPRPNSRRGRGMSGRPRETLLVALRSEPRDRPSSCADCGLAFLQNQLMLATPVFGSRGTIFLRLGATAPPLVSFRFAGRAAPPSPHPLKARPLEPRRNYTGALRFQRLSQPLPLLPRSPLLTLTFVFVQSCANLC